MCSADLKHFLSFDMCLALIRALLSTDRTSGWTSAISAPLPRRSSTTSARPLAHARWRGWWQYCSQSRKTYCKSTRTCGYRGRWYSAALGSTKIIKLPVHRDNRATISHLFICSAYLYHFLYWCKRRAIVIYTEENKISDVRHSTEIGKAKVWCRTGCESGS